ncbi:MAG: MarR family transcriptional regulator [Spirochaetes bacterium]|nr:MarR family transcriptional regulator [Spirochaetota bacterium]
MSTETEFQLVMREWVRETTRQSMRGFFRYIKDSGLSMSQASALFNIKRHKENGVTDLGEELHISSAAASQMLDKLVQQGIVSRSENPEDRRSKCLSLTDKGQEILQQITEARQLWIDELARELSPDEMADASRTISWLLSKTKSIASEIQGSECGGKGMDRA